MCTDRLTQHDQQQKALHQEVGKGQTQETSRGEEKQGAEVHQTHWAILWTRDLDDCQWNCSRTGLHWILGLGSQSLVLPHPAPNQIQADPISCGLLSPAVVFDNSCSLLFDLTTLLFPEWCRAVVHRERLLRLLRSLATHFWVMNYKGHHNQRLWTVLRR